MGKIKLLEDIYQIKHLRYEDRIDDLETEIQLRPGETSTKSLPLFLDEDNERYLFKPVSKTKPFSNDLYAIAEVYCSRIIEHYFDPKTPIYHLAVCEGIAEVLPTKSNKGNLVKMFTQPGQRFMSFAEYFKQDENNKLYPLVKDFTNFCPMWYDFTPFFEDSTFKDNPNFSNKLASLVLFSILFENSNFHYGNAGFIVDEKDNIIDVAPSYDNEFSFIFNSLENPNQRDLYYNVFHYSKEGFNRIANLSYLVKNKKPLVVDFLKKSIDMISDSERLKNFSDVSSLGDFITDYNSEIWEVHKLKKEGEISKAEDLEKKLKMGMAKISLNLSNVSEQIYHNQIEIIYGILATFGFGVKK